MRSTLQPAPLALAILLFLSTAAPAADPKLELGVPNATINTTYFIPDFIGTLVVQPRNLLAHPTLAKSPAGELLGRLQAEIGFDPRKLDEAIFAMGHRSEADEGGGFGREAFGVILRSSEPFVREKFPSNMRDAKETLFEGQKYFAAPSAWQASYAMPNDRTLVIASEVDLKKMLTARNTKSPLVEAMAKADRKKLANLVVTMAPIRKLVPEGANGQQLPPPLDTFLKMVELIDVVEVSVNASDLAIDAQLRTKNVDSADQILGFSNTLLGLATLGLDQILEQVKQGPPAQRREAEPALTLAKDVLKQLKPKVQGTNVVLQIDGKTSEDAVTKAVAMIVPQLEKARAQAEQMKSTNNLRQILLAIHNYADTNQKLPGNVLDKAGKPLLSWRVHILPYIEQDQLYKQFKLDEAWDSPHNKKLVAQMPDAFKANGSKAAPGKTTFLAVRGKDTVLGGDKPLTFAQIQDGTSNTIMVVDAADERAVEWTKPDDLAYDPEKPLAGLVGHIPGKFLAGFADGSVRIITAKIDPEMLRRAMTASDGKVVELPGADDEDGGGAAGGAGGATFNKVETRIEPVPSKKLEAVPPGKVPSKRTEQRE
jgi:hypothetical protein